LIFIFRLNRFDNCITLINIKRRANGAKLVAELDA